MTERAEREAGRKAKIVRLDMQRKGKAVESARPQVSPKSWWTPRRTACSARPYSRATASSIW
jgi:hypothetical protein